MEISTGRSLNKVMIIGWLDGTPELRYTPGGRPVTSFTIATARTWISSEGEQHTETEWFSVVAWGGLAELCSETLTKGQRVYVEGRLQTRGWEDSSGRKHYRTEVVAQDMIPLFDNS